MISNTQFDHKNIRKYTWNGIKSYYRSDSGTKKVK